MAGKIFISYRRDDSAAMAGRLYDRLAQKFGERNLFIDVDNMPAGADFVKHLNKQVESCNIFLCTVGPNWLDAKDEDGRRRLDQPDDYVRVEIAAALNRDIPVIPILIDGARVPRARELPEDIAALTRRNAVEVRSSHFRRDADDLTHKISEIFKEKDPGSRRVVLLTIGGLLALMFGGVGIYKAGMVPLAWMHAGTPAKIASPTIPDASADQTTSAKTYSKSGNFACFGQAEYPDSWREEASLCFSYGCNFGKMSEDACLTFGAVKRSKTVIHGIPGTTHSNECWLQQSCGDLRPHGEFTLFRM